MTTLDADRGFTAGDTEVEHTTVVLASSWDVLRFVSEPANLAEFLPGVITARRVEGGDGVLVTVKSDDGPQDVVATMRVDEAAHRLDWTMPGTEYRGSIVVDGGSTMTQLRAHLHAGRPLREADHRQIQHVLGILRHQIETSTY